MVASKSKKFKVIKNPELARVVDAFVPAFGHDGDIDIVNRLMKLHKMQETVDNEILRKGKGAKGFTKKMGDILFTEKSLIESITHRNNDF